MNHLKRHLSVANAISCIALFVALSGATYAATTASKNSVKAKSIARGAVTTPKLRNGAVTMAKIRNGAVNGIKIAPGAVGSTQLLDGGVRSIDLGGGVVTQPKLKDGAVAREKIVDAAVNTAKLAPDSVTAGKLATESVSVATLSASLYSRLVKDVAYPAAASPSDDATNPKLAVAECPAGRQVLGGGGRVTGEETSAVLIESLPLTDPGGARTKWMATARAIAPTPGKAWSVEAYAICAEF